MIIRKKLGEMLVESKLLTEEQLKQAIIDHKKSGLKLGMFLVQKGIINEIAMIELISRQLKIEKYRSNKYPLDLDLAEIIPFDVAEKHRVLPLKKSGRLLTVATTDPLDIDTLDNIEIMTKCEVEPVVCTEREWQQLFNGLYSARRINVLENMEFDIKEDGLQGTEDTKISSLVDMAGEPPVVRLVNSIFSQAIRESASDIHISPTQDAVQLRFRIDGDLHEVPSPPKSLFLPIIARIKILASMDITVSRMPQDGRLTLRMEHKEINVRISSIPTIYGENLVLRLLDMSTGFYTLDRLGMRSQDIEKIENVIQKPYGMILSTGPTGCGKSTTLYAIMSKINKPDINIVTLEDPVEYRIQSIRQVQLNLKAGMTFASGLRSVVRQDPDVILVGEIRDSETAAIAVHAALTGHRLLSTIHTNDAAGAVTRLIDMGIEPFLVSSVLLVSIAQRLVRTVCTYCKEPYMPPEKVLDAWGIDKDVDAHFQHGKGCNQCMNTGYKGRTGIYEILLNDEMVQEMILKRMSAREITNQAVSAGKLRTLKEDAISKCIQGITTLEEAASSVMV